MIRHVVSLLLITTLPALATAESAWRVSGDLQLESRLFPESGQWSGQNSTALHASLAAKAELRWRSADDGQRISLIPFVRVDDQDDERSLFDMREAYWARSWESAELLVGMNTVFWGVTESVHLVDIVNQTDAAGDIDGEDKLGQAMINLALQYDWGALEFFVLPGHRKRTFPGARGRLRPPVPVDAQLAVYTDSAGANHIDAAVRYSHYIGDVDIGLGAFHGTSREPRWVPAQDSASLRPIYDVIDQVGVDLQYTRDAWLWKLEAIVRNGYSDTFTAAVGGFEYTRYQVAGSAADIGWLIEYQYDGRDAGEPATINDNDVFAGARLAFNDTQDTSLLAGFSYDVDTGETLLNVEGERRLGENWFLELTARIFSGASVSDVTGPLAKDDYLQVSITRYF